MTRLRATALALLLATGACGGGTDPGPGETTGEQTGAAQPRPRSSATLTIVSPEPGAVVTGGSVKIELDLEGGRIVEQSTTELTPDTGHVHIRLDGKTVSMNYGLGDDLDVEPGQHVLEAEFVAADHIPFDPRVVTTTTFTAE